MDLERIGQAMGGDAIPFPRTIERYKPYHFRSSPEKKEFYTPPLYSGLGVIS